MNKKTFFTIYLIAVVLVLVLGKISLSKTIDITLEDVNAKVQDPAIYSESINYGSNFSLKLNPNYDVGSYNVLALKMDEIKIDHVKVEKLRSYLTKIQSPLALKSEYLVEIADIYNLD